MTAQQLVGGIGVTLIGLNYWQNQRADVWTSTGYAGTPAAKAALRDVALEAAFVGVASLLAGAGRQAASAALAVMVALSILFAVNYSRGGGQKKPGGVGDFGPGKKVPKPGTI